MESCSDSGAVYRFVKPEMVVEISCSDAQSENSAGKPVRTMVLQYAKKEYNPSTVAGSFSCPGPTGKKGG